MTTDINQTDTGVEVEGEIASSSSPPQPENEADKPNIEDLAAHDYQKLVPIFLEKTKFFSKKKLYNLMKTMVQFPFEDDKPKFSYKDEVEAFKIVMSIFDCKFVLTKHVYELMQQKAEAEKAEKESAQNKNKEEAAQP